MDDVSAAMTNTGQTYAPDDHAGHDRQLVVAYACGDLPAEDLADARSLVARCRRCAALVDEIAVVSTAIRRDLVAPPRRRDFRLTSADAERLHGNAVSRLLRRLGSPRLQVIQPLAGAAMAIGLVLMITTSVLPSFSSAGAAPAALSTIGSAIGDDTARDADGGESSGGAAEPAPENGQVAPAASGAPALESPDIAAYSETDASTKANVTELSAQVTPVEPAAPVGLGLLIVGALVLLVRVGARRASKDPLLR